MGLYTTIYFLIIGLNCVVGIKIFFSVDLTIQLIIQLQVLVLLIEIGALIWQTLFQINYPLYHMVPVLVSIFYGLIFYNLFKDGHSQLKYLPFAGAILLATTSLVISVFYQGFKSFPSIGLSMLGLFVTLCTLVLFTKMLLNPESKSLIKQPKFWFGIGSLIFYSSTFFVFGLFKSIRDAGSGVPDWGYTLIRIANYIMYTCYLITLWLAGRNGKKISAD